MDDTLLERLPSVYATALLLDAAGLEDTQIAARLDVPVESVATLLEVARAKLAAVALDAHGAPDGTPK